MLLWLLCESLENDSSPLVSVQFRKKKINRNRKHVNACRKIAVNNHNDE